MIHSDDAGPRNGHHLKFKPYQLSKLLSDNPQILNYFRSLCVELSNQIFKDYGQVMKKMVTILPGLKLECIQLTFVQHNICAEWECFPIAFRNGIRGLR